VTTIRRWVIIPVVALAIGAAGCSSDSSSSSSSKPGSTPGADSTDGSSGAGATVVTGTDLIIVDTTPTVATAAPIAVAIVRPTPGPLAINVTVGVDSAPDRVEEIPLGSTVTLTLVDPTAPQEYHVHGHELGDGVKLGINEPEVFTFTAGEFAVESHVTETVLVVLKVS
jgi:hypothetical protein